MTDVRLISWNVNGIRAIHKKGFLDWFNEEKAFLIGSMRKRQMLYAFRKPRLK